MSQVQIVANLVIYKKKLTRLNNPIVALIELGGNASIPVINMKVKNSVNTMEGIQNELDIMDSEHVQVQFDEVVGLMTVLEDNVAELEAGIRRRTVRINTLWSEIKDKDTEDDMMEAFVSDCQKHLESLLGKWSTVEIYVSDNLINQFESCVRKCQGRLEVLAVVRTAGSEKGSSIADSAAHQQYEPRLDNRKPKFDIRTLPSWTGTSTTYLAWRMRFDTVLSHYDVADV